MSAALAHHEHPLMTVEVFLAWARQQHGVLYDLVDGVPRAHDAPLTDHGVIQGNLVHVIKAHLAGGAPRCRLVVTPGIRPHIAADWNHRIPEMAVTCSEDRRSLNSVSAPLLIVEILSPSNVAATWSNIPLYASVPSVQEILIVDSRRIEVQVLRRGADGHWPLNPEQADPSSGCALQSIDLLLPFADIYADTEVWEVSGRSAS